MNHTLAPLSQKLRSGGDQIEILTSQSVNPQPEWLNFVTTAKARTKIEASLRRQRRRIVEKGQNMLDELFDHEPIDNTVFNKILHAYKAGNKEDLYYMIGNAEVALPANKSAFSKVKLVPEKQDNLFVRYVKQAMNAIMKSPADNKSTKKEEVESGTSDLILNMPLKQRINRGGVTYQLTETNFRKNFIVPSCCNPLPGDDVFGYITEKEEVEVHKRSCQTGLKLKSNYGDRIITVSWGGDYRQYSFLASIVLQG